MNTKQLLNEWCSFLNENRIIPLAELVNIIKSNDQYSEDDVKDFTKFWNTNQFSSKYSQVIKNDLEKGEPISHITDTVARHFHKVYQSAGPKTMNSIGNGTYTVDDLRKELDERLNSNRFNKSEVMQQCQYQNGRPVIGQYQDFDVIYSEEDWIVIEPKTIQGSIAWAHGKPDGSEETDQHRRVSWCTGVTSGNNMFPNYAGNLHMFYFIKSDYDNVSGPERRICLSFVRGPKEVKLVAGNGSVDANNLPVKMSYIKKIINESIIEKITSLVYQRKETSFKEVYSKITLSQLVRQIDQMKRQKINANAIQQEILNYAEYAKSLDVINYFIDSGDSFVVSIESSSEDLVGFQPSGVVGAIARNWPPPIRLVLARRKDLLEIDPSGSLIRKLVNDDASHDVVSAIRGYKKYNDFLDSEKNETILRKYIKLIIS